MNLHATDFFQRMMIWRPKAARARDAAEYANVIDGILTNPADQLRFRRSNAQYSDSGMADYLLGISGHPNHPDGVFRRLRWGGQFIFVSKQQREVEHLVEEYGAHPSFLIDTGLQMISRPWLGTRFKWLKIPIYFFVARKIALTAPGDATDRYSFDVRLTPFAKADEGYVVLKQVPSYTETLRRLAEKFPDASAEAVERGARKVTNVCPLFLTRELGFLKILQRKLPDAYKARVPDVLRVDTDEKGLVRRIYLRWLRLGGEPMSQLEFAKQGTHLLHVLHEQVGLVHMDLRLDNVVVTEKGVGFIDFGSAARVGETFSRSPKLKNLFFQMLSASQIQRDLARFRDSGKVTSRHFLDCFQKIDKAIDLFYLILQINNPHFNPDFKGIVHYDSNDDEAHRLYRLTRSVLQPSNPNCPKFQSVSDVLNGIMRIERRLERGRRA